MENTAVKTRSILPLVVLYFQQFSICMCYNSVLLLLNISFEWFLYHDYEWRLWSKKFDYFQRPLLK